MKSLIFTFVLALVMSLATFGGSPAFGQEPPVTPVVEPVASPTPSPEVTDGKLLESAADTVKQIGTITKQEGVSKNVIVFSVILVIAQLLIQATKAPVFGRVFKKVNAKGKIAIVSVLTIITTVSPLVIQGVSLWAALISGVGLSALMIAGHQVYDAFIKKDSSAA